MSDTFSKVEVITGVVRRRRFSTELELAVVAETVAAAIPKNCRLQGLAAGRGRERCAPPHGSRFGFPKARAFLSGRQPLGKEAKSGGCALDVGGLPADHPQRPAYQNPTRSRT